MPNSHPLLLGLQAFQVLFLALHDWIPLGRFNDVTAARRENPGAILLRTTIVSTLPFAIGLIASAYLFARDWPAWLLTWLDVSYVLLLLGELRAWWVPYLVAAEPERAARYQAMFARTHVFLPERNGISPNTLHVILHIATLATVIVLFVEPA